MALEHVCEIGAARVKAVFGRGDSSASGPLTPTADVGQTNKHRHDNIALA